MADGRWSRPARAVTRCGHPNDLCFGPDGALWFTDPDDFAPDDDLHGWICRHDTRGTDIRHELDNTFPNGLAFDPMGRLVWMESHRKRAVGQRPDGGWEPLAELGAETTPDGCAYATDGRLVIATLFSGGLDVIAWAPDGPRIERVTWGSGVVTTNCCFDGSALWVTDVTTDWDKGHDTGRLWRLETTLTGLPL